MKTNEEKIGSIEYFIKNADLLIMQEDLWEFERYLTHTRNGLRHDIIKLSEERKCVFYEFYKLSTALIEIYYSLTDKRLNTKIPEEDVKIMHEIHHMLSDFFYLNALKTTIKIEEKSELMHRLSRLVNFLDTRSRMLS